uniref:protein FAR-RED IMPAIRED RESPONSE 1-like n=1 Tax=Erigeron canadensis TaxID=72917 RepID=UPI001CB8D200|nr:protein FAR-RED IMPAIRED RESPONSE 1-like [Erigeron canadensis]
MVKFDAIGEKGYFRLAVFEEIHNHLMVPPQYRHLSKQERQLKYAEQLFVYYASVCNIGPTKAHQLYSSMKGCDENVNGTVNDFRNWSRDLNVYISESDSQMLINKMEEKKEYFPGFSFYYMAKDSLLHLLFWADEVARCNYKEFNDFKSFDATYQTNRCNTMFVPFTSIDNRGKCVTFGAGIIHDERQKLTLSCLIVSWRHSVKDAILSIEDEAERDFKQRFDSIIRSSWIPTYFIDTSMFGLMRTTPRSKSENAFFSHFTRSVSNLVNFVSGFESVMLKQRSKQEDLDAKTIKTTREYCTKLKIERDDYRGVWASFCHTRESARLKDCAIQAVEDCNDNLVPDEKLHEEYIEKVKALKSDVEKKVQKTPKKRKEDTMADMIGTRRHDEILINNPPFGSYKGCAKKRRIMGGKEVGIKESQKRKKICINCGGTKHNARMCGKERVTKKQITSTEAE